MQTLYDSKIKPQCGICEIGRPAPDGEGILCVKKGIMLPEDSCSHFKYDPLKREPAEQPKLKKQFTKDDFTL